MLLILVLLSFECIIFFSYLYTISQFRGYQTRHMHGIDVQGTVVILDEAHNIVSKSPFHSPKACFFFYALSIRVTIGEGV